MASSMRASAVPAQRGLEASLSYPAHAGYPVPPIFVIREVWVYWIARLRGR